MTIEIGTNVALEPRVVLHMPIGQALEEITDALKTEGFGVLTKIDVRETFQEKIGESFDPYLILGACSPKLAHKALTTDPDIGLFLPCNVVLHEKSGSTTVSIVDPNAMLAAAVGNDDLEEVAQDAGEKLLRVLVALQNRS